MGDYGGLWGIMGDYGGFFGNAVIASDNLTSLWRINDIESRTGFVMSLKDVLKPLSYEVFVEFWGHK
jgi:hypothetical protein